MLAVAAGGQTPESAEEEPEQPPVVVRAAPAPATADNEDDPWTLPDSYPGLAGQAYGGLDSALRSDRSLFDSPAFGEIIDRRDLGERQASDMVRALRGEVGVLVQQTARGQASPFVRGLTGQQVLILVDGVRLNNATFRAGPNQYFNLVDPGQVERIEVVRGAHSALWGSDAIGGVINIVTRGADPFRGDYRAGAVGEVFSTADLASYTRASGEMWSGPLGVFGGASYLNVNNLDRGGSLGRQPETGYDQYAGDLKFNLLLDCDNLLTVGLQHFEQHDLPRSDRFAPFVEQGFAPNNVSRPTFFDPQQRDLAYVRWESLGSGGLFDLASTTLSYQRNKEGSSELRPQLMPPRLELSEFDVDTVGLTVVLVKDLDWLGQLTYGIDGYYDDVDSERERVSGAGAGEQNPQFPDDSRYEQVGAFISWDVRLTDDLSAVSTARYQNVDAAGTLNAVRGTPNAFRRTYQDWIVSAGLVYELDPHTNLVASASEGFRAPNLDDLTADNSVQQGAQDSPSLDVQPEHSWTYEVGIKVDYPRLRLQAVQFWTELDDAILRQAIFTSGPNAGQPAPNAIVNGVPVPGSNTFIRDNFDSYLYGTELAGEYLLDGGWSVYGNFWYTFGEDLERDEPYSRIPPTQGILGLRWRDECRPLWCEAFAWMVDRQDRYAVQNNGDARFPLGGTPGYATLNFRAGTAWGRHLCHRASLSLENVTDQPYRVLGSGVDGAGFNAVLGYEYQY
jgi:outer membrane receptor protein involved in Fe transport